MAGDAATAPFKTSVAGLDEEVVYPHSAEVCTLLAWHFIFIRESSL